MPSLESDIAHMQAWLFRMAQTRWRLPASKVADLFHDYGVYGFIADNYGLLHLSSYDCALNDVELFLKAKGWD